MMREQQREDFNRIDRPRLSERVAHELENAIFIGTFSIGQGLPSEQKLADQFGVSRNVIREAFKLLQERGLITIQNGSGAYINPPDPGPASVALGRYLRFTASNEAIQGLYEARRMIEGTNARLAAQRATDDDIDTLANYLMQMREHNGSIEKWSQADLGFHLAIAGATHNPFMSMLLVPLVDQLRGVIAEGFRVPGAVERGIDAHVKIFTRIKNHDEEGAYIAIAEHLRDSESRFHEVDTNKS